MSLCKDAIHLPRPVRGRAGRVRISSPSPKRRGGTPRSISFRGEILILLLAFSSLLFAQDLPDSHKKARFAGKGHALSAKLDPAQCTDCHSETSCNQCHFGQLNVRVHDPDYRFTHGVEVRKKDKNCMICHPAGGFCQGCH